VAETAAHLAEVYSLDPESARLAGLLHDWCKDLDGSELFDRAEEYGIPVTDADRAVPYLLHAPVGAVELRLAFPGIPEDVIDAVRAHTYGSSELRPLEMLVYVADTLAPERSHAGVEELRVLVGEVALEDLFARTYADSLRRLVDSHRRIHPETVATWNRIVERGAR